MPDTTTDRRITTSIWRRIWHILGGSFFPVIGLFLPRGWLLSILGIALFLFVSWEIARFVSPSVNLWMASHLRMILKKQERFRPTGTTYLLLASFVVFFFFNKYVAITSLFFLALGDPLAAAIGQKFGRHRLFKKSLEGSLACLVSCLAVGLLMASVYQDISLLMAIIGALSATIIEVLPIPLDDNLTIPLASGGLMTLISII